MSDFATSFTGDNMTKEEKLAIDYLLEMMTAVKQQILLRKAIFQYRGEIYYDIKQSN